MSWAIKRVDALLNDNRRMWFVEAIEPNILQCIRISSIVHYVYSLPAESMTASDINCTSYYTEHEIFQKYIYPRNQSFEIFLESHNIYAIFLKYFCEIFQCIISKCFTNVLRYISEIFYWNILENDSQEIFHFKHLLYGIIS